MHAHILALSELKGREEAARALAPLLGCEQLVFYVLDDELGALIPAPGMAKTFAGGPRWRAFLRECSSGGRHRGQVDLPQAPDIEAVAISFAGTVAVCLGGEPSEGALVRMEEQLPLLGALFKSEQKWLLGLAENRDARLAADRARALVKALDAARASAAGLNEQLRREHARKDEFLAMLAHELRNPLSPLVNSLAILSQLEKLDPRVVRSQLDMMARQMNQLTRLVDDLLDVSRVNRGLIELRRERISLAEVVATAVEGVQPAIEAREQSLSVLGEYGPLFVHGDRVRLVQVFANLLQNAAKYTERGGKITVGIVLNSGRVSVIVRDSGVGIPPEMLRRVFDLFEQVPVSLDRSQGGLGIGLTLVRTLTELHGGMVTAHSVGVGHGSTFTVTLPLVQAPSAAIPHQPRRELHAVDARVLVVDDNEDGADSMAEMLRFMGAQSKVARDGFQALEVAQSFAPDLVLLDIGLPGMDGYEVARRLRKLPGLNLCLVAMTGYGSAKDRELSTAAGFDEHLVKPLSVESIERLLTKLGFASTA